MILDIKQIQMASQTTNQGGSPDMQCTAHNNFLHKKIPYLHALQENREMGARYLGQRYSRWISTDPALGEYIPAAGKGNSENSGNLLGMGGVFNSVHLNLFHYAGNSPVKYVDPDGRKVIIGIAISDTFWGTCIGIMCINEKKSYEKPYA